MKKRVISCLCLMAIMMSLVTTAAYASSGASFSFSLLRGANSSSTAAAYKNDYTNADIYPQSGYLYTGDSIAYRVRDKDRNPASGLYVRDDLNYFPIFYNSGYGVPGDKYLYANAPSTNYSQYVTVQGIWYP